MWPTASDLTLLRALIAPREATDPVWDQGNRAVIDLLAGWLSDMGFRTEIQEVAADGAKANLIATLGSGPGGLVLAGHTDTVPFDEGRRRAWLYEQDVVTDEQQAEDGVQLTLRWTERQKQRFAKL